MNLERLKEKNILDLVRKLNLELEDFIKNSIESTVDIEKWNTLFPHFDRVRCWEIKGCTKESCSSYGTEDYRCWLKAGTLCGGEPQGEFAKKYKSCFNCEILSRISKEPLRALYENINTIIHHLQTKALKLQELAIKDHLTGLHNRHFFNEIIEKQVARAQRHNEILTLVMIDIDNFKEINDTKGHLTGDRILAESANLIKATTRESDFAFRFGGDEFLILLINPRPSKAPLFISRLLERVIQWNRDFAESYSVVLDFSIGFADNENGTDVLSTLREADEHMYQNKKEKKNKVIKENG